MQLRFLFCNFCLNLYVRVTLITLHRVDLLVFDCSFVSRFVSIKFDHLRSSGQLSIKFDLILDSLSINSLVSEVTLGFYWSI
jgi:hypothetical protein